MEYRRLGKSGIQISALSLGSWLTFGKQIENNIAEKLMDIAYDAGVNFFDNAEIYANGESEIVMGKILKKKKWERSSYLVSSKVYFGYRGAKSKPNQKGLSRKHVIEGCNEALKRLQVDYIDLFFCHRPDKSTPIEETVWAMNDLIRQGKILYWGTSEWSGTELMEAFLVAEKRNLIGPTMEQPEYNLFHREKMENEYLHLFNNHGLGTTIWSPLASGALTGKYSAKNPPKNTRLSMNGMEWLKTKILQEEKMKKADQLLLLSKDLQIPLPQLAIGWILKNKNVSTAILGASKPEQLKETLGSLECLPKLTKEVLEKIEKIVKNKPTQPEW
jgi:voltage-dependent potassium channel beta subunit